MNFELSDEQVMLREAAADALGRTNTVAAAREALEGAAPVDQWDVAREAGWTGLVVGEEHGGAGLGFIEAMLVAEECGRRLSSPGLLGHLPATLVLRRAAEAGDEAADDLLPALASGELRAAIAFEGELTGVPDLPGADVILVGAALVDPEAVTIEAKSICDPTRPLGDLDLNGSAPRRLEVGPEAVEEAWHLGQAILAAEALGICQAMLDMGVEYAKDRHAFARPIGSYQSIKHQLVDILARIDALRSLTTFIGHAATSRPHELGLAAASARFSADEAADYATRTCIAVHGGIGATWEHDAPLYWRRAHLSRLLLGGTARAGDRVAQELIEAARREAVAA